MTRATWLNLVQSGLVGLQTINLALLMMHANPYITMTVGALLNSGIMFVHLMGIDTPTQSQIIQLGLGQPPKLDPPKPTP